MTQHPLLLPKCRALSHAGDDAAPQVVSSSLDADAKRTLDKLVGCLTKKGKKSKAQGILLEAMHIIKGQLAKGRA